MFAPLVYLHSRVALVVVLIFISKVQVIDRQVVNVCLGAGITLIVMREG
jgi:hypothetical protein